MEVIIFIVVCAVLAFVIGRICAWYRSTHNKNTNKKSVCKECKKRFCAKDIISEDLIGDGLQNSGKAIRKISVRMRCSNCENEQEFTIFTAYRHSPSKGSPAYQYFKDLEE